MDLQESPPDTGVFYINLDRVPERRTFMEAEFARTGLAGVTRFSAVDARAEGSLTDKGYCPGVGSRWGLTHSEIACFESHKAIWKTVIAQNLHAAAIFEDDVEMSANAGQVVRAVLQSGTDYDFVKLDYSPKSLRFGAQRHIADVTVRPLMEMAPSAAAYIVTRDACSKLLAWSETYSDHLDDFVSMPRPDWRMYQVFPAVGVQMIWSRQQENSDQQVKTSERTQDMSTNQGLDKGPGWFRARRELLALRRKIRWRMGAQRRLLGQGGFVGFIPCAEDLRVQ
ncbi:MAG: glycosyltransferase family 25 protein [Pseudomonadota bacterium]